MKTSTPTASSLVPGHNRRLWHYLRSDLTRRIWPVVAVSALLAASPLVCEAQTFLLDFGGANTTEHGPAPDDPFYYWNNVTTSVGLSDTGQLPNLVTTDNTPTGIGLMMVSRFNGNNEVGTLESTLFPIDATRDSLYGNTELWGSLSNIFPSFKLTGLDAATLYNFTFYASRTGVGDNRETGYTVQGANSNFVAFNAANNVDGISDTVSGIVPDASGEISISIAPTANNDNGNHFTYLNVLKMEAVPPQTPIGFTEEPVNQRIVEFEPVTFSAAVTGAPPYYVQWLSNGVPIPDARQFNYTIPVTTLDMSGSLFSVNVSNFAFSITSSNALLWVINDTNPPTLVSVSSGDGLSITVVFDELVDPITAADEFSYTVNDGTVDVSAADLLPDGKSVTLALSEKITGTFTVAVNFVLDLSGNEIAPDSTATGDVPGPEDQSFLFDFGGGNTTENGPAPDDPINHWNNVTDAIGASDTGELQNLVTTDGGSTSVGLMMIRRFNGANENGTTVPTIYPTDATRDSLYGNTEVWGGLTDIFPSFKLTGLDPSIAYTFTFYASRTGVGDNRETGYTVEGVSSNFVAFNPANNVSNFVTLEGINADAAGEIAISLAPTANNNNGNHFTYLGVLKMAPTAAPTPIGFTLEPVSQRVVEFEPVTFSAAVTGAPPYFIQWLSNSVAIPGADQFAYTIPSATLDMNGAEFSVVVSNLAYSAISSNAVLRVVSDTNPPALLTASSADGLTILLSFDEGLDSATASDESNYTVNGGAVQVLAAALDPNGTNVTLTLSAQISGTFTVAVHSVQDLSGNEIAPGTSVSGDVLDTGMLSLLLDFGASANTTDHGPAPDDPVNYWNNVTAEIGSSDTGELTNLVNSANVPTGIDLVMLSRFNGANGSGTQAVATYPTEATRDSLFGNTELFSGLSNIFPSFKLTGLDPALSYNFTFYASRTGVSDNREASYTVQGGNSGVVALNAANNVTNEVTLEGITPDTAGEITISVAPTANNNNANHFTYLGVMKLDPVKTGPELLPLVVRDGQVTIDWSGNGQLEWAPTVLGPWTPITPAPAPPYSEAMVPDENRFYRLSGNP